jgi:hypothetical protein
MEKVFAPVVERSFGYYLIHNGFNESAYAYCDHCVETCLLNLRTLPYGVEVKEYGLISEHVEPLLKPCECGGSLKTGSATRCPNCSSILSPIEARTFIEANAEGTKGVWRWQEGWNGLYCIVIENRLSNDCWKSIP